MKVSSNICSVYSIYVAVMLFWSFFKLQAYQKIQRLVKCFDSDSTNLYWFPVKTEINLDKEFVNKFFQI